MERIAVIGAGNIGEALISGLVGSGVEPDSICLLYTSDAADE